MCPKLCSITFVCDTGICAPSVCPSKHGAIGGFTVMVASPCGNATLLSYWIPQCDGLMTVKMNHITNHVTVQKRLNCQCSLLHTCRVHQLDLTGEE